MQDDSRCPVAKTETLTTSPVHHHAPWVGGEGSGPQRGTDGPDVSCLVGRVPGLLVWCLGVLSLEGLRTLAGRESEAWGPGIMDERATIMDTGAGLSSSPQSRQVSRGQRLELSLLLGPAKTQWPCPQHLLPGQWQGFTRDSSFSFPSTCVWGSSGVAGLAGWCWVLLNAALTPGTRSSQGCQFQEY